jgi:hypothetical protein
MNKYFALTIATLITSAIVGASIGWFFPYPNETPTQVTETAK